MFPVGITTGYDVPLNPESLAAMKESGLEAIELSPGLGIGVDFPGIRKMADAAEIRLWSCHLPFRPVDEIDISLESKQLRDRTVRLFSELIRKCADIGVDKFVIHPSTPLPPDARREERLKYSMDTLNQLAEVATPCGAVLAVEEMTPRCLGCSVQEMQYILSAHEKLQVCFDLNHLFTGTHADFIKHLGDKIVTLHVSDKDTQGERHWLPGEGVNPWYEIYASLKQSGYQGVWLYELSLNGAKSVDRGRPLTFRDYYRNAMEIFSGQPITVIRKEQQI